MKRRFNQISNPKKSVCIRISPLFFAFTYTTRVPHHDRPPSRPEWSLDGYDRAGGCASLVACFSPRTEPRGVLGSPAM